MISLPPAFTERMQQLLGNESETFFQALVSESPTSIRLNPKKTANTDLPFPALLSRQVPWCSNGYYLKERPSFTSDPLLHGGAYYVQEASSMFLQVVLEQNRGDYTKAIEDFRAVLERDPNHLFALMNLASARSRMYDYIESIEEKTSRVVGEEKKVERNVDYSLVLEGNNKCLEIDPEFVFAMFNIANVYAKSGEIQKAIDMYTKVLEVDKDIAEAYFNRGLLYIYQGNRSAANVDLSKAGELGLTDSYSIIKRYCSVEEE